MPRPVRAGREAAAGARRQGVHCPSNNLSSLNDYAPLADFWAAHGFVVVQPTHLTSRTLSHLVADAPGAPFFWRSRAEDMTHILDRLD